jgi:hypothetical protein
LLKIIFAPHSVIKNLSAPWCLPHVGCLMLCSLRILPWVLCIKRGICMNSCGESLRGQAITRSSSTKLKGRHETPITYGRCLGPLRPILCQFADGKAEWDFQDAPDDGLLI